MRLFHNGDYLCVTRCQRGWTCQILYGAYDAEQFTKSPFEYQVGSRFFALAILKAVIGAWIQKRRLEREAAPLRAAKGW